MAKRLQLFRCEVCGQIVMVFNGGGGTLACCGQPMAHLEEGTQDASLEKHVPVVEKIPGGFHVKVGQVAHPMLDEHHIRWVELIADGKIYCQFLKPGDAPEAVFHLQAEEAVAREYCNLHGYWKGE